MVTNYRPLCLFLLCILSSMFFLALNGQNWQLMSTGASVGLVEKKESMRCSSSGLTGPPPGALLGGGY